METLSMEPQVHVDYDPKADVLYLNWGVSQFDFGEDAHRGVLLRFAEEDESPTGVTVVGFVRNRWNVAMDELAQLMSAHLKTDPQTIFQAISGVMR
jgi:hypothetical protein